MSKNEYAQHMDELYTTLSSFIHKSPTNSLEHYDPQTDQIRTILDKISNQLCLFRSNNRDEIQYYNNITYYILECYQLLQRITPIVVDQDIKCQLLDKTILLFNVYVQLMDDNNARKEIKNTKGSTTRKNNQRRAKTILLPRIIAKHLTNDEQFMDHDFLKSIYIQIQNIKSDKPLSSTDDVIKEYLKINSEQIKIDKAIVTNDEHLKEFIYNVYEEFFNEVKRSENITSSDHYFDGHYSYRFRKYNEFSDYKSRVNLVRSEIFKTIKVFIKQCITSDE